MSQQYPQQPNQPYQGGPASYPGGPAPYQPPPPPKKGMNAWAIVGITIGGIFAFLIILGIAVGGGENSSDVSDKTAAAAPEKPADKPADKTTDAKPAEKKPAAPPAQDLSQADQFKAFVAKNGTAAEKAAVKHVTKVQGADKQNGIADTADIHTDYAGGLMGPHQGEGKLLASAFADWKTSENGLVTVYDKDGELLSNGNF